MISIKNSLIFWLLLVGSFLLIGAVVVLEASGYQINWRVRKIQSTGLILIDAQPKDAIVKLNQRAVAKTLPFKSPPLLPGNYEIEVSKAGFVSWRKLFTVEPGQVVNRRDIQLFFEKPIEEPVTDENRNSFSREMGQSDRLTVNDHEVYLDNRLVTRFSGPILGAWLFPDGEHVLIQVGPQLLIVDRDGSNPYQVTESLKAESVQIVLLSGGQRVLIKQGDEINKLRVWDDR